jgi:hypothetical protein
VATEKTVLEGELTWFSPVIPEEDYEVLVGGVEVIHALPLDESDGNRFNNPGRIGPWFRLSGRRVRVTIEVMDE